MATSAEIYQFSDFSLNTAKRGLFKNGEEVKLRDKDLDLLLFLISRTPNVCSHDEIIETVWGGYIVENNSIEKAIGSIRSALGDHAKNPKFIKTVRTKGYLFIGDVDQTLPEASEISAKAVESPKLFIARRIVLSAIILLLALIAGGWYVTGPAVMEWYRSRVVFSDDFSLAAIDTSRWEIKGKNVMVDNGVAKLVVEETDNWGRLISNYFVIDPNRPITIKSRIKVKYSDFLKEKVYFHGAFRISPKTSITDESEIKNRLSFGVNYANYDWESQLPDGSADEQKTEGFFLVAPGSDPTRRLDYEKGRVSPRISPVWDKWFDQKLVYDPQSGKMDLFIDGDHKCEFNAGRLPANIRENKIRVEINPEGWWLYHSIELDYIEVTQ